MRNSEHYLDPTAGRAMTDKPVRISHIVGPEKKKRVQPDLPEGMVPAVIYTPKKTKYINKPAYVSK